MGTVKGVSIIVPCYNSKGYVRELVTSVVDQQLTIPWEIIIVNDCSTDPETIQALSEVEKEKKVKVVHLMVNQGSQVARNTALQLASYDYIFPIDSDDKLSTDAKMLEKGNYLERAVAVLESNPSVLFVHCAIRMFGAFDGYTISSPYPLTEELISRKHHVTTNLVYRKSEAINAGMYATDIKKWQDWSFGVALMNERLKRGQPTEVVYFEEPYVLFRNHGSDERLSNKPVDELEMTAVTIRKYPELFGKHYPGVPQEDLPRLVLDNKPSKLIDLLYVAVNNLEVAKQMVQERHFVVINDGIPRISP